MTDSQTLAILMPPELVHYWGWFLAFGIGLASLCVAAVARAFTATIASMLFFGWLLVIAAAIEIVQAVMVGHWAGSSTICCRNSLRGAGLLLVTRPLISAEALTFVMAIFFLIGGLFELLGSLVVTLPGWGWQAADGIITIVLGALVLAVAGLRTLVIGLFIGIDLIFYGFARIALALGLRAA